MHILYHGLPGAGRVHSAGHWISGLCNRSDFSSFHALDDADGAACPQPFRAEYPVNPSWEIAKSLPEYLPVLRAKDPSSRYAVNTPPVRILVHPEPIRVSYKTVRELVPSLWEETYAGRKIDLVIHIGMAGPRPMYQIESRGHRTGYKSLDVDGKHLDSLDGERGEDWIWHGLPETLKTDLDMQDIWERWQQHSSVRPFVPGKYIIISTNTRI